MRNPSGQAPRITHRQGSGVPSKPMRILRRVHLHNHRLLSSEVGEINLCTRFGRILRAHYRPCDDAVWIWVPVDRLSAVIAARSKGAVIDAIFDDVLPPPVPAAVQTRTRL